MTAKITKLVPIEFIVILVLMTWTEVRGGDQVEASPRMAAEETKIREIGIRYVEAFNSQDSSALAKYWSPDAVYTNRLTGEQVVGREAIAEQFATLFSRSSKVTLRVLVESIDFLAPNVAIEKGVARFTAGKTEVIPYSAVYVRSQGNWLLDRVTDDPQPRINSHYEQLKSLEWLIGAWMDQGDGIAVQANCKWTSNRNFIVRSFKISTDGQSDLSGIQIIGWDAGDKEIRSWTFDSDGGTAEAKWTNSGDEWYVIKKGKTSDGKAVSAVNVMTYLDDDTFKLKTVQRSLDGQLLPNLPEVTVSRQ